MTKPLLTSTDIKIFILEAIRECQGKDLQLSRNDLSIALGVDISTIDRYKFQGMPYVLKWGKIRFPLKKVLRWLDRNNKKYDTERLYEFEQKE